MRLKPTHATSHSTDRLTRIGIGLTLATFGSVALAVTLAPALEEAATPTNPAAGSRNAPARVVAPGASMRDNLHYAQPVRLPEKSCDQQTWPYLSPECLKRTPPVTAKAETQTKTKADVTKADTARTDVAHANNAAAPHAASTDATSTDVTSAVTPKAAVARPASAERVAKHERVTSEPTKSTKPELTKADLTKPRLTNSRLAEPEPIKPAAAAPRAPAVGATGPATRAGEAADKTSDSKTDKSTTSTATTDTADETAKPAARKSPNRTARRQARESLDAAIAAVRQLPPETSSYAEDDDASLFGGLFQRRSRDRAPTRPRWRETEYLVPGRNGEMRRVIVRRGW